MNKALLFVLSVIVSICAAGRCNAKHPVILMPGIMGSVIHGSANIPYDVPIPGGCERVFNDELLWVKESMILRYKCLMAYFRYDYDGWNGVWQRPRGVTYSIPKWNSTFAVDDLTPEPNGFLGNHIPYYHDMIERFKSIGYVDGDDLFSVGYDWKEAPTEELIQNMKRLFEATYKKHGKVLFVAHSMGGPYSYYFLRRMGDQWVKKYIYMYVPIAPAWMGAVKAVDMMIGGLDNMFSGIGRFFAPLVRHLPSVWFLLPNATAFKNLVLATSPSRIYSFNDVALLLNDCNASMVEGKMHAAHKFFDSYGDYRHAPPVPVRQIVGTGSRTVVRLDFRSNVRPHDPDGIWDSFDRSFGDGDSTVPTQSFMYAYNLWQNKGADVKLSDHRGLSHMDLVQDSKVIDEVVSYACK